LGVFFNIFATAEASDFKFGKQLGFAKAHSKFSPRRESWGFLGLGQLLKLLGFPFNISAMAEASDLVATYLPHAAAFFFMLMTSY